MIDLNGILLSVNLLFAGLTVLAFSQSEGSEYVDANTVLLAMALAAQTHLALMIKRRDRNPLVLLLAFSMTVYHLLRLLTLILYPFSNVFVYAGLYLGKTGTTKEIDLGNWTASAPGRAMALVVALWSSLTQVALRTRAMSRERLPSWPFSLRNTSFC